MNAAQARRILAAWRPGTADDAEPAVREALALAEQDPDLGAWLVRHRAFQQAVAVRLRAVTPPAALADRILAARKTVAFPPPAARRRAWWLAAAAAGVLAAGAVFWMTPPPREPEPFEAFRRRMVGTVLREYRMDIVTNDLAAVRGFLAARGAPSGYVLPSALQRLPVLGGGELDWRGRPVAMTCLDRGGTTLFLFAVDRGALGAGAPAVETFARINRLETAAWSDARHTFLLAAQVSAAELRALLAPGGDAARPEGRYGTSSLAAIVVRSISQSKSRRSPAGTSSGSCAASGRGGGRVCGCSHRRPSAWPSAKDRLAALPWCEAGRSTHSA